MQLFDTASGVVVPITPRGGRIGMYVCGITPYDGGHIGHAFTYHTFDVISRRLRADGVTVHSVRNVTDIDDDILRVAHERKVDFRTLAEHETRRFDEDLAALGLLAVDAEPRATDRIPEMVEWVIRLIDCGAAYEVNGWVYFDVATYPDYGWLSGLAPATMELLSRTRGADPDDPRKRNPLDFVLWQPSRANEPSWPSPWSAGRPGWHIECTVLAATELPLPIDIHGGGEDLVYPHHESEIAQAVAAGVPSYARCWVHVAMVGFRGEKMSKSLGNLVFVRDLLKRVPSAVIRLMLSAHHHRSSWEYSEDELERAQVRWSEYMSAHLAGASFTNTDAQGVYDDFMERLDDDLDTPGALAILDEVAGRPMVVGHELGAGVTAGQVMEPLLEMLGAPSILTGKRPGR